MTEDWAWERNSHPEEDSRWQVRLSPEAAARKLLRAKDYLLWSWGADPHLRDGVTDAIMWIDICISRCRSSLRF